MVDTAQAQEVGREEVEKIIRQQHLSLIGGNKDRFYSIRDAGQMKTPIVKLNGNKPSFNYCGRNAAALLEMDLLRQQFDERGIQYDEDFGDADMNYAGRIRQQAAQLVQIADRMQEKTE